MKALGIFIAMTLSAFAAENTNLSGREKAIAWAIQFAGEEGGSMSPKTIKNYPYAVAKAISYGFDNPNYITPLFSASVGADASCAEMQSHILATVLLASGDTAFSEALSKADKKAQTSSCDLLESIFRFGKLGGGVKISWKDYAKTYKLIQNLKKANKSEMATPRKPSD